MRLPTSAVRMVVGIAVLLAAGCASSHTTADSAGSSAHGSPDVGALDRQAKANLAAWEPVLARRGGAPFLLKGEPSQVVSDAGAVSDEDGRYKEDWVGGRFTASITLPSARPAPGTIAWPGGATASVPLVSAAEALAGLQDPATKGACGACTGEPLQITGVQLGTVAAMSSRGQVQEPAWIFSFAGYRTRIAYPAVAPDASVMVPDAPHGILGPYNPTQTVALSPDGRTLTVTFEGAPDQPGPCGSDVSGHAFEAAHAVALVWVETMHGAAAGNAVCPSLGQMRKVSVPLASALDGRVVLGLTGMPMPIG